jgi:hypothetical protein
MDRRFAKRYCCMSNISKLCDRGEGQPPRKSCRYCKSALLVAEGMWATYPWQADNRYSPLDAQALYLRRSVAEQAADRHGYVVRWLPRGTA